MDHEIAITRTQHEDPEVADALHLRCSCGWTSSASDEATAEVLAGEHRASGEVAPIPSVPSPD